MKSKEAKHQDTPKETLEMLELIFMFINQAKEVGINFGFQS